MTPAPAENTPFGVSEQCKQKSNARRVRDSLLDRGELAPDVVAELLELDPDSGRLFWKPRAAHWFRNGHATAWNSRYAGTEAFTATIRGRKVGYIFSRLYQAHRVIFAITNGRWPAELTDHIDGNKRNNRPDNLREASPAENSRNRSSANGSSIRYLGVCRYRNNRWQANICHNRKKIGLGKSFRTEEDAARAYDAAAHRLHGEFARLNFPSEVKPMAGPIAALKSEIDRALSIGDGHLAELAHELLTNAEWAQRCLETVRRCARS